MRRLRTSGLQFLLALLLSLALWTFVSFTENPTEQRTFVVPVNITNPRTGLLIVDPSSGEPITPEIETNVQVTGPELDLNELATDSFTATADLSPYDAGLHSVPIRVRAPVSVRQRNQNPATVQVRLALEETRTFTITRQLNNQLPFLFELREISTATDQVAASGPQNLMAQVDQVVAPIELQGQTTSFTRDIDLVPLDENGEPVPGITLVPDHVKINAEIETRVAAQRASVLPRFSGQPAPGYTTERIDWNPKFVEFIATQAITVPLETEPIDLTGRTESFSQTVRVISPPGLQARLLTDRVTVSVPIVPFEIPSNVPLFVPVSPTNLSPDLQVTADPPSLTITVSGTFDQLSQLANATVQATVDLSGLGPGTYPLQAVVQLPPGLQIVGEQPQVTVTITPKQPADGTPPALEGG